MRIKSVPITLVTGYLGSGKTTFINYVLTHAKGHKFAVIVNDLGEVNIDAELIAQGGVVSAGDDNLVALQNGCICCTLKGDLIKQLADLVSTGKFDHILIEASGICEPVPIAQTICYMEEKFASEKLPRYYYLDAIVSVADALRLKDEFCYGESLGMPSEGEESIESLIIQQLEFCDIVLLNKASEISEVERERVEKAIRAIQRGAEIIETDYASIDVDLILDRHLFSFEKAATSAAWIAEFESRDNEDNDIGEDHDDDHDDDRGHEDHHHHHHHHHENGMEENDDEGTAEEYGIQTFVYYRRPGFDREKFLNWAQHNPHKIIRSKGICYFLDEQERCYVYETAGRQIKLGDNGYWFSSKHTQKEMDELRARDEYYAHDYDDEYKDKLIKLVFIGQNLNKKAIKEELDLI